MNRYWLKNFLGLHLSEAEMWQIPNPRAEIALHVTMRSIQTGALLGSSLAPLSAILSGGKRMSTNRLSDTFVCGGIGGALVGALLSPVLTNLTLRDMDTIQMYDKCYQLRTDKQQLRQDRSCFIWATLGYITGGSIGLVVGLDLAVILSNLKGTAW